MAKGGGKICFLKIRKLWHKRVVKRLQRHKELKDVHESDFWAPAPFRHKLVKTKVCWAEIVRGYCPLSNSIPLLGWKQASNPAILFKHFSYNMPLTHCITWMSFSNTIHHFIGQQTFMESLLTARYYHTVPGRRTQGWIKQGIQRSKWWLLALRKIALNLSKTSLTSKRIFVYNGNF